ncbi:MAG: 3-hydroxyacyl-CoA dehydrogenase [Archaeoglobaceae archaeon]|nr:3-hydroxyacyl-CoA dehydrogenase [Archaeoglobaceae archaeon]MDW8127679.1 3-hydroxyacyl-CoA dehydrogenase NAD-binding domain-containing protein [Archaeoglobaceae archaeon]
MKIKKVAVLGAGEMGHGIAENCAMVGYEVWLRARRQSSLDDAMNRIREGLIKLQKKGAIKDANEVLSRIHTTTDLKTAVENADLLIESIPEVFEEKVQLFAECDKIAKPECIFATNTSTMSITKLAKATKREDKFIGMHFFTPVVIMEIVELTRGEKTSDETLNVCIEFLKSMKKIPIVLNKETPGFIVNRVVAPTSVLRLCIIENGIATPEEVDATYRKAGNVIGLFELWDYLGLDVVCNAMKYYSQALSPDYEPKYLEKMVKEGKLGKKSGHGFYDWSKRPEIDLSKATERVDVRDFIFLEINEAVKLVELGVADPRTIDTAIKLAYARKKGPFEIAREFSEQQISKRLEELAKKFGKKIFEPAETIKKGKLKELIDQYYK